MYNTLYTRIYTWTKHMNWNLGFNYLTVYLTLTLAFLCNPLQHGCTAKAAKPMILSDISLFSSHSPDWRANWQYIDVDEKQYDISMVTVALKDELQPVACCYFCQKSS